MRRLAHSQRTRTLALAAPLAVLTLTAGCTATPPPSAPPTSEAPPTPGSARGSGTAPAGGEASTFGVDPAVVAEVQALCTPGPGKTVDDLPDVVIPAVTWPGVSVPEQKVGSTTAPALVIPPVDVPATTAEAGCLVTYDAPAGCLPAVAISAGWIPGYRIEGFTYLDAFGATITVDPLVGEAVIAPGANTGQVCQAEIWGGSGYAIDRYQIDRYDADQYSATRYEETRHRIDSDGESAEAVTIPALTIPQVTLPHVFIGRVTLPARKVAEDVTAVEDETVVAYEASEAVLFEYNKSTLLPDAAQTLDTVLADAAAKDFTGPVRVEGHTDDTGDEASNQRLSEARAQAIADYLTTHGIASDRITTTGRGETTPAYPNDTDANRAKTPIHCHFLHEAFLVLPDLPQLPILR